MIDNRTFDGLIFAVTRADLRPFFDLAKAKFPMF